LIQINAGAQQYGIIMKNKNLYFGRAAMQSDLRSNLNGLMGLLTGQWKSYWEKRAAINELANCDPSEVARIAEDLGISTTDLRFLAASDKGVADLLKRRLQELRIDPTSVDPAVMRDLQLHCAQCNSKKLCAHELEDKPPIQTWPLYCPNQPTIDAVTAQPLNPNIIRAAWPRKTQL
jgi:Family of unknown function (DUF6455)